MKKSQNVLFLPLSEFFHRVKDLIRGNVRGRPFGLKAKITFLIVFNVAAVLLLSNYLDYHFSQKNQIDLFLNRNVYLAKQIDLSIPDPRMAGNLSRIQEEMEEWLLSRPFLIGIDLFLFDGGGWEPIVSIATGTESIPLTVSKDQIGSLRQDKVLSSVQASGGTASMAGEPGSGATVGVGPPLSVTVALK